ncbi:MAG: hypothetical protein V3V59_01750 [Thermodesulfovibrionales bacterium]
MDYAFNGDGTLFAQNITEWINIMKKFILFISIFIFLTCLKVSAGEKMVSITLKNGTSFDWNNYNENGDYFCTSLKGGSSLCVLKKNVASMQIVDKEVIFEDRKKEIVTITLKDGTSYQWDDYFDNGADLCTILYGGNFCVSKAEVALVQRGKKQELHESNKKTHVNRALIEKSLREEYVRSMSTNMQHVAETDEDKIHQRRIEASDKEMKERERREYQDDLRRQQRWDSERRELEYEFNNRR